MMKLALFFVLLALLPVSVSHAGHLDHVHRDFGRPRHSRTSDDKELV